MGEAISVCWEESQPPDVWEETFISRTTSGIHLLIFMSRLLPLTPLLFQGEAFFIAYKTGRSPPLSANLSILDANLS